MPKTTQLSSDSAMVRPPASRIQTIWSAPSSPMPVISTPIVLRPYTESTDSIITSTPGTKSVFGWLGVRSTTSPVPLR